MPTSVARISETELTAFKIDRKFPDQLGQREGTLVQKANRFLRKNTVAQRVKDFRSIAEGPPPGDASAVSNGTGKDMRKSVDGVRAAHRKGGQPLVKQFEPEGQELPGRGGDLRKRRAR